MVATAIIAAASILRFPSIAHAESKNGSVLSYVATGASLSLSITLLIASVVASTRAPDPACSGSASVKPKSC